MLPHVIRLVRRSSRRARIVRDLARRVLGVVALALVCAPQPAAAWEGSPVALDRLQRRLAGRPARAWVADGIIEGRDVRADEDGITFGADATIRRAGSAAGSPERFVAGRIAWSDVDSIATRRSLAGTTAIVGTFLFTLGAVGVFQAANVDPGPGIAIALAFPPLGAAAGAAIGSRMHHWKRAWPDDRPERAPASGGGR